MPVEKIADPKKYFEQLGDLHDATITNISFNCQDDLLTVSVDDLNANLEGFSEYPGLSPADLIFVGVRDLSMQMDEIKEKRVHDCAVSFREASSILCCNISPEGVLEFSFLDLVIDRSNNAIVP